MEVMGRNNNWIAPRVLKKLMQREGVFRDMKRRKAYEKPSERHCPRGLRRPAANGRQRLEREGY